MFWLIVVGVLAFFAVLGRVLKRKRAPELDDATRKTIDYAMVQRDYQTMHDRNTLP